MARLVFQSAIFMAVILLLIIPSSDAGWWSRRRRRRRCSSHSCTWKWSSCSKPCGGGTQRAIKTANQGPCGSCNMPTNPRRCNIKCCPVDCVLSHWGNFGKCSHGCGVEGSQKRTRVITRVGTCGGVLCSKNLVESRKCNQFCFNGGSVTPTKCACPEGRTGSCCELDVDECQTVQCMPNAKCINTDGSYECVCEKGFTKDGTKCLDVDECHHDLHDCHKMAQCINIEGHYTCKCNPGYSGNGTHCHDIDECGVERDFQVNKKGSELSAENSGNGVSSTLCHKDAVCINTDGAFRCECETGFEGDGQHCEDVDECAILETRDSMLVVGEYSMLYEDASIPAPCHENATCFNNFGSYSCWCNEGFYGDGMTCKETNECESDPCRNGGKCVDKINHFICICLAGYNGSHCELDIDECAFQSNDEEPLPPGVNDEASSVSGSGAPAELVEITKCAFDATCSNAFGSYSCTCNTGFVGTGFSCLAACSITTVDLLFVMDGSGSVGVDFKKVTDWIKHTVKPFEAEMATGQLQVGVVQFSHYFPGRPWTQQKYIKTEIRIGRFRSFYDFANAVDLIKPQLFTTHTGRALEKVAADFNSTDHYKYRNNKQVMYLVTDGKSSDPEHVEKNAHALRKMGVVTYAIGVRDADVEELRQIATGDTSSNEREYHLDNFDQLDSLVFNELRETIDTPAEAC